MSRIRTVVEFVEEDELLENWKDFIAAGEEQFRHETGTLSARIITIDVDGKNVYNIRDERGEL